MSRRELQRVEVMARVGSEELKLVDAGKMVGLSYRQVKRLWRRYREEGPEGLKHRSAGRESNRAKSKKFRERVLRLVRKKYSGEVGERFGPTLAAEHLESEDQLQVHAETLRRWMLAEGLWRRARKRRKHRRRREPKAHFGELVQLDGSFHLWFEQRGPEGCLMNLVDDATTTTLGRIGAQETTWTAARVLRSWIEQYGVPLALYTDWQAVYLLEPTEKQLRAGQVAVTQFGRMCARLGIRIIAASSPQAKGRVERNHGTHQDRLVKKLRRKKIGTYEVANEYLEREYLPEHNRRFAHPAASPEDYHRQAPTQAELDEVFRLESERVIGNDWVVRYQNRFLQVKRQGRHYAPAKAKVVVCEWEDGRLEIHYRGQKVAWEQIAERPQAAKPEPTHKVTRPYGGTPPTANHPWKQRYDGMKVCRPPRPGLDEAEIALDLPLRSALNARPSASQDFASGQAQSDQTTANRRGHF
ncbi:MAG: ISNCY family transposase [Candidatus Neomarinimicrobiota bacterium]